ncbi:response regulator [Skermania piniformis]|uniref:Response regulator transcription factor n=1 Tax=Skermania pinensis TaxID=39122 RepID=A0ABX8S5R6_9ACTN|nr:response regulator transcription factor [Skermania piniformis]QXQ13195.1 response regulator transcription factor [Skermania piniformis]
MSVRVVVADDQALIRSAVVELLRSADGVEVVAEAVDGREAVARSREHHPDVVLMDIRMPVLDGIAATAQIRGDETLRTVRVLILTTFEEDEYLLAALRAGADGFIGKGAEPEEIVHAVHAVDDGDALLSPAATRSLIGRFLQIDNAATNRGRYDVARVAQLTPREREILVLVASGMSNQEIAEQLVISPYTAKTHVNNMMTKLDAPGRAQLVIWAYESGLVTPGA